MIRLENDQLKASISPLGAELQRLFHKQHALEYLWSGDPAHWGKHAPVLFPIVGQLIDNTYIHNGKRYSLNRHGFAREMAFQAVKVSGESAVFELKSNEETRLNYPFDFLLKIIYTLEGASLLTEYEVSNTGDAPMYFSIGAHPAFAIPLTEGTRYEDYYLRFDRKLSAPKWPLLNGLIRTQPQPCIEETDHLPLSHQLFYDDALIFKNFPATSVSIASEATNHGVELEFDGFPYLGIWAAADAPFVCIEPWCGIADAVYHNQELKEKEGIISLEAEETWTRKWSIRCS